MNDRDSFKDVKPSPILKWAGGKTQLLPILNKYYPKELIEGDIETYIEPFFGGGAVYFDVFNNFNIKKAYLFDINPELVILYNTIKTNVEGVINELKKIEDSYLGLQTEEARKEYFYEIRSIYNSKVDVAHNFDNGSKIDPLRSAMTIFLNRTCFNGLFRVNSKGYFNVPHGRYKNPTILFEDKLRSASYALQNAQIKKADFTKCTDVVSGKTFIYYDPPYRPVNQTSQFTSYSKDSFDDTDQIRLAETIKELDKLNTFQLMSNSDPTNYVQDPFFDNLYSDFKIVRINASRRINSNAKNRGDLREILVTTY